MSSTATNESEKQEINNYIIDSIKDLCGKSQSEYHFTNSYKKIGLDELDALELIEGLEKRFNIRITAPEPIILRYEETQPKLSLEEKKKMNLAERFLEKIIRLTFNTSIPIYQSGDTDFPDSHCLLSPEKTSMQALKQLEQNRKRENKTLQGLTK